MKIKAQMAMVMNLDKCIGCHTCSIPCKYVWTNRPGTEYIWFNNVETKPGIGYPKKWEDQRVHRGGWEVKEGKLRLVAGEKISKLFKIFHNPDLPPIDDYYEPWTYNYETLMSSPLSRHQPVAKAKSLLTGERIDPSWGPGWEDDLAGANTTGAGDVNFKGLDHQAYLRFAQVFMFYLPRICEHCLNPACVASCPSGALYKREDDGIVLVDQERCRGWRYCVSGCPYKKVYYNWHSGRSEKCLFCYPRIEGAMTTLCSHSCVGRIRSVGVVLYDADQIKEAASVTNEQDVYKDHREMLLNPNNPEVAAQAREQGVRENFIKAAQNSPIYKLAVEWKIAFPPHPEFRTLPMVWYVPPLGPLAMPSEEVGVNPQPDSMRIPVRYLANLLAAGDEGPIRFGLSRLLALRAYMRSVRVDGKPNVQPLEAVGLDESAAQEMYRLLAIAKERDRYVLPTVKREDSDDLYLKHGTTGIPDF